MMRILQTLWKDEEGPTAVEYAILASLIGAVIVATVATLGVAVRGLFEKVTAAPW